MVKDRMGRPQSRESFQSMIAFCVSTSMHMAIGLTLAFMLVATQGNGSKTLRLSMTAEQSSQEIAPLEISVQPQPEVLDTPMDPSLDLKIESTSVELKAFLDSSRTGSEGTVRTSVVSPSVESAPGAIANESAKRAKSKSRASFFGAEADGNKFVFVIDSSGSMRGTRWQALCTELIRALQSLSPDQEFFVISFDAFAHPMFGTAPPKGEFLTATSKNVRRVQNWIRSIEHGRNTFPASAVGMAMRLKPDAIFLLSDGEIADNTIEDLEKWNQVLDNDGYNKTLVPIHTVLLHSQVGYATLERIAKENSGTFTPVRARP